MNDYSRNNKGSEFRNKSRIKWRSKEKQVRDVRCLLKKKLLRKRQRHKQGRATNCYMDKPVRGKLSS